ncbi:hypothetical protein EUX48_05380, partial [Haemophilus haemolyticus]
KGLTINQDATVTATEGNATLKGSSIEQNGTVKAKQNATLEGGTVTNSGSVTSTEGKVGVNASDKFTNTATGNLTGKTDVAITANDADVAGKVTAETGKASVIAQNKATISGAVSGQDVELEGKKGLTINQDATVTATEGNATLKGSSIEQNGTVKAKQNATLEGGTVTNSGSVTSTEGKVGVNASDKFTNTATGNLTGKTDVAITAKDADVAGTVTAETGAATISATNNLSIKEGSQVSGANVGLKAGENLNIAENARVTATKGDVNLEGKNITNVGIVTAKGKIITKRGNFKNNDLIEGKKDTLKADENLKKGKIVTKNNGLIKGKKGTIVLENPNAIISNTKDTSTLDLIDSFNVINREVRPSLRANEITLHQFGDAKIVNLFNDGRKVSKVTSIISNGSACNTDLDDLLASCITKNSMHKGQYHEVFSGKVQKGNVDSVGKSLKSR